MESVSEADVLEWSRRHVWHPFTQAQTMAPPLPIRSARGTVLTTMDGREILDMISSWWVNVFGHAHPEIVAAIQDQVAELEQVIFAGFTHPPAAKLANELAGVLPEDLNRVFFSDDGSTSVEVAIKLAYQVWRNQGEARTRLMSFDGAYHGDTFGAMSAGRGSGYFEHWGDLLFPIDPMPYPATWWNDPDVEAKEQQALSRIRSHLEKYGEQTFAMILEPLVQGASGMRMVRPEFVAEVVRRARAYDILVIFDEVMTGFGRTGTKFACERTAVPDVICLSKGLTGGFLPLSVTVVRDRLYEVFLGEKFDRAFAHGHSFTANPVGCAAALASLKLLLETEKNGDWARIESAHRRGLESLQDWPQFAKHRLIGTIGAVNLETDDAYDSEINAALKRRFLEEGFLIRPLANVVYLLPPYCTDDEQIKNSWQVIAQLVSELTSVKS